MQLATYSMGIGDRFGRQGEAQLRAMARARADGLRVVPVWNKSHREHGIIGTCPEDVRREADAAVQALGWTDGYHVDADHVGLANVDAFIAASDFFTLDVADAAVRPADAGNVRAFVERHGDLVGELAVPGADAPLCVTREDLAASASRYLEAVREAGRIYRHIEAARGAGTFVTEVSIDETDRPQLPRDLLVILAALADERIPAQTLAPRFSGRFNKGVDYVGDLAHFEREFNADLDIVRFATRRFALPSNLKLSVHSGSDKFSIYPIINRAVRRRGMGLHLKTAGTTWLEELIGLAAAGADGAAVVREVYRGAWARFDELCRPYASVIDIDRAALPAPDAVDAWRPADLVAALAHDPAQPAYNPNLRQLLHVGYKVAAEMGPRYRAALTAHAAIIADHVTANILDRHIRPIFGATTPLA